MSVAATGRTHDSLNPAANSASSLAMSGATFNPTNIRAGVSFIGCHLVSPRRLTRSIWASVGTTIRHRRDATRVLTPNDKAGPPMVQNVPLRRSQ
jgi:hypothetical protein